MKRRFLPILPITVGLILVGGLVYAMEKKNIAKPAGLTPEMTAEEEAFKAELLDAIDEHEDRLPSMGVTEKKAEKVVKAHPAAKHPVK